MTMEADIEIKCECMTEDAKTGLILVLDYAKNQDEIALDKVKKKVTDYPAIARESYIKAIRKDIDTIAALRSAIKKVKVCPQNPKLA